MFSTEFIKLRKKLNYTQKELSKELSIPLRTIRAWEQNYRKPTLYQQELILTRLDCMIIEREDFDREILKTKYNDYFDNYD